MSSKHFAKPRSSRCHLRGTFSVAVLLTFLTLTSAQFSCTDRDEAAKTPEGPVLAATQAKEIRKQAPEPRRAKRRGEMLRIPSALRKVIEPSMLGHGDNMESLLWSALMLDYESVETIAGWLGERSPINRAPANEPNSINANIPEEFFRRQDSLRKAALELQATAKARDADGLAKRVSSVVATCIGCHALFNPSPSNPSSAEQVAQPSAPTGAAP